MNNTRFKKKAQEYQFGMAIITVVIIILAISVILIIRDQQDQAVFDLKCTQSIDAHIWDVKMNFAPKPIQCPTQYITVKEKESTEIMKQLARQQVLCWNQWKKGEENLFAEDEGIFCHVCYVDEFKHKNINIDDYENFLRNHKVSEVVQGGFFEEDMFLIDYLVPYGTEKFEEIIGDQEEAQENLQKVTINTSKDQAVIFFYVEGETKIHDFAEKTLPASVVGGVLVAGAGAVGLISAGVATGGVAIAVAGVVTAVIILTKDGLDARFSGITIKPYTEQTLLDMGCEIIPSSQRENT